MMALLVRREVLMPRFGAGRALAFVDRETDVWMGLYLPDDSCVGIINTQTRPEVRDGDYGQHMRVWARISMTLLSQKTSVMLNGHAWASRDKGLKEFTFTFGSGNHEINIAATINDGLLKGDLQTAGESIPLEIPVGKDLVFSGNMGTAALNVPGLKPGDELYVDTFDPMTMSVSKAKLSCVGEEEIEYAGKRLTAKVMLTQMGPVSSKAWVSYDNEVLRAETPFGFTLRKLTHSEALEALSPREVGPGLLGMVAIHPTGKRPARGAEFMRVRLANVAEAQDIPEDDTQQRDGAGGLIIRAPAKPIAPEGPSLPNDEREEALKATVFVQARHPTVRAMADQIVGDEPDVWRRARHIYRWVYENIEKTPVMSLPSALDVLRTREGDCNEHTVLFAALARAAHVPTRIAIGIAWSDRLNAFYYHAWPEVYVGRWVWMDPTLGQRVADATHIKLVTGDIEKWTQLLPYIGQLEIEVLEIQGPAE